MAAATSQSDNSGAAWRVIEPYWQQLELYGSAEEFIRSYERLPKRIGHLMAVHWCDSEVCNGGFHQFFYNSTGILAPESIEGFRALGLPQCLALVEQAVQAFGNPFPRDCGLRGQRLASLMRPGKKRSEWDPFSELDEQYYRAIESESLYEAMDRYAATT